MALPEDLLGSNETAVYPPSDDDDCFVAEVPELPGCMAHGDNRPEAVASAEEAIALWIDTANEDGRDIPRPKGRLHYA